MGGGVRIERGGRKSFQINLKYKKIRGCLGKGQTGRGEKCGVGRKVGLYNRFR